MKQERKKLRRKEKKMKWLRIDVILSVSDLIVMRFGSNILALSLIILVMLRLR